MCVSDTIEYTFTIFNNWSNLYYLEVDGIVVASGNNIWGATGEATVFGSFLPTLSPAPSAYPTSGFPSVEPSVGPIYGNNCATDENFVLIGLETDTSVNTMKWKITNVTTGIVIESGT